MLERRSPLDGHVLLLAARARAAALSDTSPAASASAVILTTRHPHRLLQVTAFAASIDAAAERLAATIGLPLPSASRYTGNSKVSLRATGPGIWQIVGDESATPDAAALRGALDGVASVVDLSHARAALRVSGLAAARTLAKHCGLDLDAAAFPTGAVTNTRFGHLGMTLARIDDAPTFELLVFRGYAVFVFESLVDAAEEFGVQVWT